MLAVGQVAALPVQLPVMLLSAATAVACLMNIGRDRLFARASRNVAWIVLGLMLLGAFDAASVGDIAGYSGSGGPLYGLARLVTVIVLAYAALKHEALGVDVKIRWGVSRSTMAAAFVAVFFLASEAAQQFFGETSGSAYFGIVAAGMLVFALAPLQRVAERIAERAVPLARPDPAGPPSLEPYRRSVRFAFRDGRIDPDEELHLFEVAGRLGLSAGEAMRVRQDVQQENRGDTSAR